MAEKQQTIEEKLGISIHYNLNILKIAVKTSPEFDQIISPTMFLKSNTKAFIHVTHFLFNILDAKEFKTKFYWPLNDKRAENSYRQSSVDFINMIIEKYELEQEKVRLASVVHPGGRNFMSLILDLISLAIDEVNRRKNFEIGKHKSIDLEKTKEKLIEMNAKEKEFVDYIEAETKRYKEASDKISSFIVENLLPSELPMHFLDDFMADWSSYIKSEYERCKRIDKQVSDTYKRGVEFYEKVKKLLAVKNPAENFANEFPNVPEDLKRNGRISIPKLVEKVNQVLPVIFEYLKNVKTKVSQEEEVQRREQEEFVIKMYRSFLNISKQLKELDEKVKELQPKIKQLKENREKAQLKARDEESEYMSSIRAERERKDNELKELLQPHNFQLNIDTLPNEAVANTRISLMEDSEQRDQLGEMSMYRIPRTSLIKKVASVRKPQNDSNRQVPSVFKGINTRNLLERATTSRNRINQRDGSRLHFNAAIPRINVIGTTPRMSSTMLSATHYENGLFNCTGVSEIGNGSPQLDSMIAEGDETPFKTANQGTLKNLLPPGIVETPVLKPDEISTSPRRQLIKQFVETKEDSPDITLTSSRDENKENLTSNEQTITDFTFAAFRMKNDEDLFDVSDSVLNLNDDIE